MKKRPFQNNTHAISVMYDAVFFVVLVSLSGAILLPAMQNNIATNASVDKHREELVDETLLMLMTSREPEFGYMFAGTQIESLLGNFSDNWLINTSVQALLGKQMQHKTYADLCAETLTSQLNVFHNRINIFTEHYNTHLEERITSVIQNHTGDKYGFNLSLIWHPITGLPIGGELYIGETPPQKNSHVAQSYITLPETTLSTWLSDAEDYIRSYVENDSTLQNITMYLQNFSELNQSIFQENLTSVIENVTIGVLFDGVNTSIGGRSFKFSGVITTIVDFIFDKIQGSIKSILDKALSGVDDLLTNINGSDGFSGMLDSTLIEMVAPVIQKFIPEFNTSDIHNLDELFTALKTALIKEAKTMIRVFLTPCIKMFVDMVMELLGPYLDTIAELSTVVLDFFSQRINVLRAEIRLTIWEARS